MERREKITSKNTFSEVSNILCVVNIMRAISIEKGEDLKFMVEKSLGKGSYRVLMSSLSKSEDACHRVISNASKDQEKKTTYLNRPVEKAKLGKKYSALTLRASGLERKLQYDDSLEYTCFLDVTSSLRAYITHKDLKKGKFIYVSEELREMAPDTFKDLPTIPSTKLGSAAREIIQIE